MTVSGLPCILERYQANDLCDCSSEDRCSHMERSDPYNFQTVDEGASSVEKGR